MSETETKTFQTFKDLCDHMGADASDLGRRLYKDTACGAHLTLHMADGTPRYSGNHRDLTVDSPVVAVQVGSIVEGSDVCIDGERLDFPFTAAQWNEAVEAVEDKADFYWRRDNHDHFLVEAPGVMHPGRMAGVDAGWGEVLFDDDGTALTPAERASVTQALLAWEDPQPGQKRKVGDLTVECYSQDHFTF